MFLKKVAVIILFLLVFSTANSQFRLDNWKAHTSVYNPIVCDTDADNGIWAGTSGGLYYYNTLTGDSKIIDNINALISTDISMVNYDKLLDKVFIGSYDGVISSYSPSNNTFIHNTGISTSNFPIKKISSSLMVGNLLYVVGGFGLAVYDVSENVIIENTNRFGTINNAQLNSIIADENHFWIAGDFGVARAEKNSILVDPANWDIFAGAEGLMNNSASSVFVHNNDIYAISDRQIAIFDGIRFEMHYTAPETILSVSIFRNKITYNTAKQIIAEEETLLIPYVSNINTIHTHKLANGDENLIILYQENGLGIFSDSLRHIKPDSPITNSFKSLAFSSLGSLWVGTDRNVATARGIMHYRNGKWTNLTASNSPIIGNTYWKISTHPDGRALASSFASGFLTIAESDTGFIYKAYNTYNSALSPFSDEPNFIVAGDSEVDARGNIWIANMGLTGSPGPILVSINLDETSQNYTFSQNSSLRFFSNLAIDIAGTKWIGGYDREGHGIIYYNDRGTDDKSDDLSGIISSGQNAAITSNMTTSLSTDLSGMVWIGMVNGLSVVVNPTAIISGNEPIIRNIRLLGSNYVNDIMVDPLDNKWIATFNGVWVLTPDASEVIAIVTKDNSPLPTNDVQALAIDKSTGTVYFGTDYGLYSAESFSVEPQSNYSIKCYPQPFKPKSDDELVIDGLTAQSEIRIVTIDGQLVRSITALGRKAIWDGRNSNGDYVKSGIYLVLANSTETGSAGVAKIAVIAD